MMSFKMHHCNECYSCKTREEGCFSRNPEQFIADKEASCLDGTWKEGETTPNFRALYTVIDRDEIDQYLPDLQRCDYHFVPEEADKWWTARSIWNGEDRFDLLPDRMTNSGGLSIADEFITWLNGTALKELPLAMRMNVKPSEDQYVLMETDKFAILGSPNASYGYCYLSAWVKG